jgi:hypothetical protein
MAAQQELSMSDMSDSIRKRFIAVEIRRKALEHRKNPSRLDIF